MKETIDSVRKRIKQIEDIVTGNTPIDVDPRKLVTKLLDSMDTDMAKLDDIVTEAANAPPPIEEKIVSMLLIEQDFLIVATDSSIYKHHVKSNQWEKIADPKLFAQMSAL